MRVVADRNWLALFALWTALATWLLLIGGIVATASFDDDGIFDWLGWVALGFGTVALVLTVGGVTMIRSRGETAVAIVALVLVLALTTFSSPLFFYGFSTLE